MIDFSEASRFIAALCGSKDASIVFQVFDDDAVRKRTDLTRVLVGTLREHLPVLNRLQNHGAGVFVQINAGTRGNRNVTRIRALFVDDDTPDRQLDVSALPPSMIVESSKGKRHYYWLPSADIPIDQFKSAQKRLIAHFGTDKGIHNLDRVMRLPGSYHLKDRSKPYRGNLVELNASRHTLDEVMAAFPPPVATSDPQAATTDEFTVVDDRKVTPSARATMKRICDWLDQQKVRYEIAEEIAVKLVCCFNSEHKDMMIRALPSGAIWGGCFHNSCGGNQTNIWLRIKAHIGGFGGPLPGFGLGDHMEIARRLLADLRAGNTQPVVYVDEAMWQYTVTNYWRSIDEASMARVVHGYSGLPVGTKSLKLKTSDVNGVLTAAKREAAWPKFFDDVPAGLGFRNGFVRVSATGIKLEPLTADHRQREGFAFDYEPEAEAPRHSAFLREIFEGDEDAEQKIMLLQEFLGAALTGCATTFQTALMMIGEGANGKSTWIAICQALFPAGLQQAIKPQDLSREYSRARLVGVRLNAVSEVPESDILESEGFKAVIDGSLISARDPYGAVFNFRPVAAHILAANKLPGTIDFSHGFWRRFKVVPFNRRFAPDDAKTEVKLEDRITATELPGIAKWALVGAVRLLARQQYTDPPSSEIAKEAWRLSTDTVALFLDEGTQPAPVDLGTTAAELYDTFRGWLATNGHRVMASTTFWRRLATMGMKPTHTRNGNVYPVKVTIPPLIS